MKRRKGLAVFSFSLRVCLRLLCAGVWGVEDASAHQRGVESENQSHTGRKRIFSFSEAKEKGRSREDQEEEEGWSYLASFALALREGETSL